MKNILLATIVVVAISSLAFAGNKNYGRLAEQLELDDAQTVEFQQIIEEGKTQRKAIREESKAKMHALHSGQKDKLSAILNPEQMAIYESKMDKFKNRLEKRKKKGKDNRYLDE